MIAIPPTQYRLFGKFIDEVQATDLCKSLMNSSLRNGSLLRTREKSFLMFNRRLIWSITGVTSFSYAVKSSDIYVG